jgi:hypothetical protein
MSSFGIRIYLFTTLLLASILSISVGNDYLFRTQGIVLVIQGGFSLQTAYAQEQDEETEDEEDEEPDNDDNNEEGDEEEDNGQTDTIGICCSWDERLADGVLTYRIIERVGEDNDDGDEEGDEDSQDEEEFSIDDLPTSDSGQRRIVTDAVNEWNARIPNLRLVHEDSVDADIEVQLVDGLGGMAAGATLLKFDEDGFINKVTILLPKAAFFIEGDSGVFAVQYDPQKLKEIATHELGHALGLGHADFDSDLMSERLSSDETMNISQCDVTGVLQANQWKLVNNDSVPNSPDEDEISC